MILELSYFLYSLRLSMYRSRNVVLLFWLYRQTRISSLKDLLAHARFWYVRSLTDFTLDLTYPAEAQPTSSRWRALTHSHIRSLSPNIDQLATNEVTDTCLRGVANVLSAGGAGDGSPQDS